MDLPHWTAGSLLRILYIQSRWGLQCAKTSTQDTTCRPKHPQQSVYFPGSPRQDSYWKGLPTFSDFTQFFNLFGTSTIIATGEGQHVWFKPVQTRGLVKQTQSFSIPMSIPYWPAFKTSQVRELPVFLVTPKPTEIMKIILF